MQKPQFISERIAPEPGAFNVDAMARGEPSLPRAFTWRGQRFTLARTLDSRRQMGEDRGDAYVRRHWYDIETTDALRMSVYFDRNPKDRSKRRCWWLYTLTLPEPVIVTKRLALRRWTFADRNIFFAMVRDPHVMTHLHDLRPMSEKEADAALSDTIDRYPGGFGDWAIVELTTGDIIGESGLTAGEKDDIEITWILLPRYWGCGFGFESAAAVKAYALEHVRLQRLVAFIRPDNRPSQRIAEKLGMHNMGLKDRAGQAMLEYEFRP